MYSHCFLAADKYDVKDLWEECIFYMLVSSIRVYNAIALMILAHLYSIEELEEAEYIFYNLEKRFIFRIRTGRLC